ncbi:MAG: ECF transporter S component [Clostridia bacterium]|nr:ECF transporter S component [Clostridia bacterium]
MKKKNIIRLTVSGMLIALEILMAFTPVGYLKIGLLSITFMTIPVIVGAVTNGLYVGTVLGLTFGITSFVQCFGMDAFGTALFQIQPVYTFILCVATRTLMGFLCALIYKGLSKTKLPSGLQVGISAFSAPFLNTAFFVPCLILFFWNTDYIRGIAGGANVLKFLVGLVGVNGIVEWIACTAVGTAVCIPLLKALRRKIN